MIENVLFDLDGTVTDSGEGITKSVAYALDSLGITENDENALWFCEGINELLAFAHSPTSNDRVDLDLYLERRKNDIKFLYSPQLYEPYAQRYFDYAPIGFLTDESMDYIKYEMNNSLFN